MSAPSLKKATKKTFHFPKGADTAPETTPETEGKVAEPTATVAVKKKSASAKKVSKEKKVAADAAAPVKAAVAVKEKRAKKEKVVRDSFTMPKSDYDKIAALKQKCLEAGVSVKKGEILRAGLVLLESAALKRLLAAVSAVEQVKTGRPAKS
ncbi:hypothetical protein B0G81_7194 [Paraburkholderia sp. BL6665CI2N2]|uniref:hypothetical protein n=1 Tax=Paraburkholderia sp. BL6665CI2N2 TaxID=1938806 RepID=UPI0010662B20|nr:hypothetical protein [Paraburkholderia sp. BL6665CI2N2]TDY26671.1 hypothetical protein B0G81_7194 [Paraburkholderia sp. BL6665CI2N2]